jgi:uncharacterized protein (DUF58 family)
MYVDTHDKGFRQRFETAARQREASINESLKHAGVDVLPLSTDEDMVRTIVRFASIRERRHK